MDLPSVYQKYSPRLERAREGLGVQCARPPAHLRAVYPLEGSNKIKSGFKLNQIREECSNQIKSERSVHTKSISTQIKFGFGGWWCSAPACPPTSARLTPGRVQTRSNQRGGFKPNQIRDKGSDHIKFKSCQFGSGGWWCSAPACRPTSARSSPCTLTQTLF